MNQCIKYVINYGIMLGAMEEKDKIPYIRNTENHNTLSHYIICGLNKKLIHTWF